MLFTFFSFLRVNKYPPSLLFLLITLGPAMLALWLFDREAGKLSRPMITIGRVPLFFLPAAPAAHSRAGADLLLRHVRPPSGLFVVPPFWAGEGERALYPAGFGYGLTGVYVMWLITILLLYPLCAWFARLKQRRRDLWLSYL